MIDFNTLGAEIQAMDFDSVYRIEAGHAVRDDKLFAPSVYADTDGDYIEGDGWEFVTNNCSGQFNYNGPIMHASEQIGAGIAERLSRLSEHYFAYATVVVEWIEEDDDSDEPAGWAIIGKRVSV
jgi:hypothetical protein